MSLPPALGNAELETGRDEGSAGTKLPVKTGASSASPSVSNTRITQAPPRETPRPSASSTARGHRSPTPTSSGHAFHGDGQFLPDINPNDNFGVLLSTFLALRLLLLWVVWKWL